MKKFIATIITAVMVVTMANPVIALASFKGYGEDGQTHSEVAFSDMEFEGYDGENLRKILDDMEAKRGDAKNATAIVEDYKAISKEFDTFATQYALNNIRYYGNPLIEEYAEIDLELSSLWTELADATMIGIREALKSPCGDALKAYIDNEELVEDYLEYEDMTERQMELSVIGDKLVQEYDESEQKTYTAELNGREWTAYDAEEAYYNEEIDQETYYAISLEISRKRNAVEAEIYAKLVNAKNESARIDGYRNYAEYAYKDVYNRDYSLDDAKRLYSYVKKYFVPLADRLYTYYYSTAVLVADSIYSDYVMEDEELVDLIEPYVAKVDTGLVEAYDYLKKYHTYEMDHSQTKIQAGYTTSLYQYGCPFIFNCPDGSYYDVETLIHEFGHYNNSFHNDVSCLEDMTNMDVAEIHSQGLEMLMLDYFDDIYGQQNASAVRFATLYNLVSSVIQGCLYDEFQNEVFAYEGEITATECNRIFRRLAEEYGQKYGNDLDEAFDWVQVNHTYHQPLYYMSYATSALASFDIFALAAKDRKGAIDLYMTLTTYGLNTPLCELLETVGLPDIFEEETIKTIVSDIDKYSDDIYKGGDTYKLGVKIIIGFIVVVLVIIAVIVLLIVLHIKKKKKKRALAAAAEQTVYDTDTMGSENTVSGDEAEVSSNDEAGSAGEEAEVSSNDEAGVDSGDEGNN